MQTLKAVKPTKTFGCRYHSTISQLNINESSTTVKTPIFKMISNCLNK
jgi:hypothetical protein